MTTSENPIRTCTCGCGRVVGDGDWAAGRRTAAFHRPPGRRR